MAGNAPSSLKPDWQTGGTWNNVAAMDPRVQFVRTVDGVNIAYWEIGEGPVLIALAMPSSHIQREWQMPTWRAIYEYTARGLRFVRYDPRGLGLSDRDIDDFSIDALVRDLEAVVDRLGVPQVRLAAFAMAGTVGLAYAARHPERVSHLIVVNGFERGSDATSPKLEAVSQLVGKDWEFASEGMIRAFGGWESEELARAAAATLRESIDPAQMVALIEQLARWDVSPDLPRIAAKTLVIQNVENPALQPQTAKRLAAAIPNCEVVMLNGPVQPFLPPEVVPTITRFFSGTRAPGAPPPRPDLRQRTAVIVFADIAGSTELTEKLGDVDFRARTRALDDSLREIIAAGGGEVVEGKLLGDGVLAIFVSAREAIDAALRCAAAGGSAGLPLHLGLHAGDVIREGGNVYGGAVNVAARVSAEAGPGEVIASDLVRSIARTSSRASFEDRGQYDLKGVTEPLRLYLVLQPGND
jgi:class 3 adenylate cyclase/pimeloyl-ACP methyl ester carboxylesterase